jgi:hypothetical protein
MLGCGEKDMGKMKAYMMDLQEEADYAISEGANSAAEVIMYMRNSGMPNVDEHWVTKYYTKVDMETRSLWIALGLVLQWI